MENYNPNNPAYEPRQFNAREYNMRLIRTAIGEVAVR